MIKATNLGKKSSKKISLIKLHKILRSANIPEYSNEIILGSGLAALLLKCYISSHPILSCLSGEKDNLIWGSLSCFIYFFLGEGGSFDESEEGSLSGRRSAGSEETADASRDSTGVTPGATPQHPQGDAAGQNPAIAGKCSHLFNSVTVVTLM